MEIKGTDKKTSRFLFLVVFSLLVLLVCSATSPLYQSHDWTDANTYLTMGRGLLNGAVPYRDLFDHKGPVLYAIYALGALLDSKGFGGVFLLQWAGLLGTLWCLFGIGRLFVQEGRALVCACAAPVFLFTAGIYYLPQNLDYGGGSAEEFCLPLFAFALWLVSRGECQGWQRRDFPLLGLSMGLVLQIKLNLALFWVGLLLPVFLHLWAEKRWKGSFRNAIQVLGGILISFAPYVLYALVTGSLGNCVRAYLTFNQSYAAGTGGGLIWLIKHMFLQAYQTLLGTPVVAVSVFGGFLGLCGIKGGSLWWKGSICGTMAALGAATFVGRVMLYNLLPLMLFAFFGVLALMCWIPERLCWGRQAVYLLCVELLVAVIAQNQTIFYKPLFCSKTLTCQQQIAQQIRSGPIQNPSLLEAGMLNRGFYNELRVIPSIYYFYLPNVSYDQHPEILDCQLSYILAEETDYVVLQGNTSEISLQNLPQEEAIARLFQAAFAHYNLKCVVPGTGAVDHLYYYLFGAES